MTITTGYRPRISLPGDLTFLLKRDGVAGNELLGRMKAAYDILNMPALSFSLNVYIV